MEIKKTVKFGEHELTIKTGLIAKQASSVVVDVAGTTVLVTAVGIPSTDDTLKGFLPLRVDYQEKAYAAGTIPGGFIKREGRPAEREILIARLIDRPIRPLFPKYFTSEVQVTATVLSVNPEIDPDIPAIIGASAALSISGIPIQEPLAAAKIGYIDGVYQLNPTFSQLEKSDLELVVAGTKDSVLMVESEANMLSEEVMLGAVVYGQTQLKPIITAIEELKAEVNKPVWDWNPPATADDNLRQQITDKYQPKIDAAYAITDKVARKAELKTIKNEVTTEFLTTEAIQATPTLEWQINDLISSLEKNLVRTKILNKEPRIDNRNTTTVRPIAVDTGILERTHGSALFTRGETQALAVITLGTEKDAQIVQGLGKESKERFMLHYNFPGYSVGEINPFLSPKRREIGHGNLAKRSLKAVLPTEKDFPYVVRLVSEITESNGSSSMATVCAGSLALMSAGVPLKAPVAGIAMGLIKEQDKFAVLTDILGDEDHLGDMDFKVAGTKDGITALQMDIKIPGITEKIMDQALAQAKDARLHILDIMNKKISTSNEELSTFAPSMTSFKISTNKIKDVIGKGGANIKSIIEDTGASIDIKDDGTIQIAGANKDVISQAQKRIELCTAEVEVGTVYLGKVIKIVDFGAFVNILPGKDGLLHISQISEKRLEKVTDELTEGQEVKVKVTEVDQRSGKIKLTKRFAEEAKTA